MKTVRLALNEDQFYLSDLDSFCSESLQSCLVFQKEEGSNEWHHTRDEDLFQWGIFLFEWNCLAAFVRSEKMKVKDKKGKLVRGKREGVKSGKSEEKREVRKIHRRSFSWLIPSYFSLFTYYVWTMCWALSLAGSGGASQ